MLLILRFCQSIATLRQTLKDTNEERLYLYPVIMPLVFPTVNEAYLCTSVDVSNDDKTSFWIRGFEPKVQNRIVHHMALAGCYENPINDRAPLNIWNCGGSYSNAAVDLSYPIGSVCNDSNTSNRIKNVDTTLFLWSRNGSKLMLPSDVGFKFGGKSRIKHLVLQVFHVISHLHTRLHLSQLHSCLYHTYIFIYNSALTLIGKVKLILMKINLQNWV